MDDKLTFFKISPIAERILNDNKDICIINVDYTLSAKKDIIKNKCMKGYQDHHKFLIIVLLMIEDDFKIPENIPFKDNVMVLPPNEFCSFMGYRGDLYNEFMTAVDLAKKSIFDSISQKELYKIAKVKRDLIFQSLNYSTEKLINSLRKRNKEYLLK